MATDVCFVIGPIGAEGTDTRKHADQVFRYLVLPAADANGFKKEKVERADHLGRPGIITHQILQRLNEAPLVVADLSGGNGNAFYELAVRHVIRKPTVHLMRKGESLPFDVANMRTVFFDLQDLDDVERAKEDLTRQMGEALQDQAPTNPVTAYLELVTLQTSANNADRQLAELTLQVRSLQGGFEEIRSHLAFGTHYFPTAIFGTHSRDLSPTLLGRLMSGKASRPAPEGSGSVVEPITPPEGVTDVRG